MRKSIIIAASIIIIVLAVAGWKIVFKPAAISVASQKADISIDAATLLHDFETNEKAANAKYLDKVILVTGTVEYIKTDSAGFTVYLTEDGVSGVLCSFDRNAVDSKIFRKGEKASVKGICSGYLMDVVLNKCSSE